MNNNRTVGIVATVLTTLCCACPGLLLCVFGGFIAAGQPINTTLNGVESQQVYPTSYGIFMLCLALIFILIPFVVGFFTLRKKPAPAMAPINPNIGGPMPPAS